MGGMPRSYCTRFPKFGIRPRILANELRKAKGTGKPVILMPLFDLKFVIEFAASQELQIGGTRAALRGSWAGNRRR
jgi:hypothetical protein